MYRICEFDQGAEMVLVRNLGVSSDSSEVFLQNTLKIRRALCETC